MSDWCPDKLYNVEVFKAESKNLLNKINRLKKIETVRSILIHRITQLFHAPLSGKYPPSHKLIRMRDCSLALQSCFSERSEAISGFSSVKAIWDISKGILRNDLTPDFFAELINWVKGIEGRANFQFLFEQSEAGTISGRKKAIARSNELDVISELVETKMHSYANGLSEESQKIRQLRKNALLSIMGASTKDWENWRWQLKKVISDGNTLKKLVTVNDNQCRIIEQALKGRLPFGVTPYYLSLMEDNLNGNDRAIRAQVLPPEDYVSHMLINRKNKNHSFDFMLESETSPINLITRRYPNIVILKPVKTCPQICVYCQRNWEINQVMGPNSFSSKSELDSAIQWIKEHPSIREVLVTGGDPFILSDKRLEYILQRLSDIDHIDLIRFGTRVLVTLPMRITTNLANMLGKYREPGRREIAIMTHIEHPYEITPDTVIAVDKLKKEGINIYNQQVYTFYVSRRFESAFLRILLKRIGIDPYYTFMPKGKEETQSYRLPLSRILQEQKEEARLVPGLRRTDEAVFNIPGLGKNYLRARQHRDLLTVLPDGRRMYEFHPWDINHVAHDTYIYKDVSIVDYLTRLSRIGENPEDYDSIWFYM